MEHITSKQELDDLLKQGPVVIDFFASWCGPCKELGKRLPDLQKQYPHITFVKIDVDDDDDDIAADYGVSSIPHVVFSKSSDDYTTVVGYDWNKIVEAVKKLN